MGALFWVWICITGSVPEYDAAYDVVSTKRSSKKEITRFMFIFVCFVFYRNPIFDGIIDIYCKIASKVQHFV
jgi:hypothetical protein